jgi:hypothetical protein
MTWFLGICTAGWIGCGSFVEHEYPSEKQCYRAIEEIYKRQGPENFKWVTCSQTQHKPNPKDAK